MWWWVFVALKADDREAAPKPLCAWRSVMFQWFFATDTTLS